MALQELTIDAEFGHRTPVADDRFAGAILQRALDHADEVVFACGIAIFGQDRSLPRVPAVYICVSFGLVLYVGKATNLRSRWAIHHRRDDLKSLGCEYIVFLESEAEYLLSIESKLIEAFTPVLNEKRGIRLREASP